MNQCAHTGLQFDRVVCTPMAVTGTDLLCFALLWLISLDSLQDRYIQQPHYQPSCSNDGSEQGSSQS